MARSVAAARSTDGDNGAATSDCCGTKQCAPPKPGSNRAGCDFAGQSFAGADQHGSTFRGIDGRDATFTATDNHGSTFAAACLQGASFRRANLRGATWGGACLFGADFTGADLGEATTFADVLFCGTVMPDGSVNDRDCGRATACCQAQPAPSCQTAGDCADQTCATKACQNGQCVYTPVSNGPSPNAQCTTHCCEGVCCDGRCHLLQPAGPLLRAELRRPGLWSGRLWQRRRLRYLSPRLYLRRGHRAVSWHLYRAELPQRLLHGQWGLPAREHEPAMWQRRRALRELAVGRTRVRTANAAARPTAPASPAARTAAAVPVGPVGPGETCDGATGQCLCTAGSCPSGQQCCGERCRQPNGSVCCDSTDCCSLNCFNNVCTDLVAACGGTTCESPANGCAGDTCCGDPATFSCGESCCGPPSTVCNDQDGGCSSGCGSSGSPCCQDSQCCEGVCCAGICCGAQGACLNGQCVCVPKTCAELGRTCGTAPDGCGGTLSCGTCGTGDTPSCHNGVCASCAATCPSTGEFCVNLADGDTVCCDNIPSQLRGKLFLECRLRPGRDLHCELYDQRGRDATESDHDDREHLWRDAGNVRRIVRVLTAGGGACHRRGCGDWMGEVAVPPRLVVRQGEDEWTRLALIT